MTLNLIGNPGFRFAPSLLSEVPLTSNSIQISNVAYKFESKTGIMSKITTAANKTEDLETPEHS